MARTDTGLPSSPRLRFRAWTPEDLPLALELWGDPLVTRWIDLRDQLSEAEVQARLLQEIQHQKRHGFQYWPLFCGDAFVGCCGVRPYAPEAGIAEFGVHIASSQWGKGYATEAALAVFAHAFEQLSMEALFAGHHPENAASKKLLERLGFRYTHDEWYAPTGLPHPSYQLTRQEFGGREQEQP